MGGLTPEIKKFPEEDLATILGKIEVVEITRKEANLYGNPDEKIKALKVIRQGYTPETDQVVYTPFSL